MSDQSGAIQDYDLPAVVARSLPLLRNLSLFLDTYGREEAHALRKIVADFDRALPASAAEADGTHFIVSGTFRVSRQRVSDLLCGALESGTCKWFRIVKRHAPDSLLFRSDPNRVFPHLDYPLNRGGCLEFKEFENSRRLLRLDLGTIRSGLTVMAQAYTRHFADFINENDDAITGDVFLQCCLLGEVVYG